MACDSLDAFELLASRFAMTVAGPDEGPVVIFGHGFGCNQAMWLPVLEHVEHYCTVRYDMMGCGGSDWSLYDADRYDSLDGYADDLLAVAGLFAGRPLVYVGHSVGAMIGVRAAVLAPDVFDGLVLVAPSPCYLEDGDYHGGFQRSDIDQLLSTVATNFVGWTAAMTPVIAGDSQPRVAENLAESFCRMRPDIARRFATVTFTSDGRADLARVQRPTLVIQSAVDSIASPLVGRYVAAQLPDSRYVELDTNGHCPHMTAPAQTWDAAVCFIESLVQTSLR
jgi:sigma-B regulation protein RsbQ